MSVTQINQGLLDAVAHEVYTAIATSYPVCSCSDEFYFFPQVVLEARDWSVWDDFSAVRVAETADILNSYEELLESADDSHLDFDGQIDLQLLQQTFKTLREQLTVVAVHKSQPTFHLTILAAGLAEALDLGDSTAWRSRALGVPSFLQRAADCLDAVPHLFQRLGLEMLADLHHWLSGLRTKCDGVDEILDALTRFKDALNRLPGVQSCQLPDEHFDLMLRDHLGCGLGVDELLPIMEAELEAMEELLAAETARRMAGGHWRDAARKIPFIAASGHNLRELYNRELQQMQAHCHRSRLIPDEVSLGTLDVAPVPDYMSAIRASDAYAAIPGYPPQGGVFYVMEKGRTRDGQAGRTLEYRLTAVHEAWPGHHLLDTCRWGQERALRRPLESPLFYEGWACLAEEIMMRSGYLNGPWDRFLLAKRRAERAARGLIDLGLQSGRMSDRQACEILTRVGYQHSHAQSVVAKYLLRPGYQVCYTLGLIQGLDLLDNYGRQDLGDFTSVLLRQGEIGFTHLANVFTSEKR